MKIRLLFISLLILIGSRASAQTDTYFPYPIVPDSVASLTARCGYLADHFWDFCEFSKAFSARQKMAAELKTYLKVITNAEPKAAIAGVDKLMKKLEKQPKDQLFMATEAEKLLYNDSADAWIDELYLPFARAIVANKRISKAEKARFAHQVTTLTNSLRGQVIPSLPYTLLDGSKGDLANDSAEVVIVFFNDPDCSDCNMARLRLDADISTTELINEGRLKIVALSLADPDDEWKAAMARYPKTWTVGAAPDADLTIDLRSGAPDFYILGRRRDIRFKHLNINQVLDVTRQLKRR